MINIDLNIESRHAWLKQEQQSEVKRQTPQSDFEHSPHWRLCFCVALIVIGFQVFSPEPASIAPAAANAAHVRSMV
ncbi:hypothetical protein [Paraburkholderia guartelaensis]|uniref:Uncharacterized protein n=1 Tax=Paraburkholderia guartelaensis TaxID=2546446 RepID=A0ABU9SEX0_9BURK